MIVNPGVRNAGGSFANALAHLPALTSLSLACTSPALVGGWFPGEQCAFCGCCCCCCALSLPHSFSPLARCPRACGCLWTTEHAHTRTDCELNEPFMMKLAPGLSCVTQLRFLDLSNGDKCRMYVDHQGAAALGKALGCLSHLQTLKLARTAVPPPVDRLGLRHTHAPCVVLQCPLVSNRVPSVCLTHAKPAIHRYPTPE